MTRRIALLAATSAAFMLPPAGAAMADSVTVTSGVLTYTSEAGTVDTVRLFGPVASSHLISESSTPSWAIGPGCTFGIGAAWCGWITSVSIATLDGDDSITVEPVLPATIDAGDGDDTVDARNGAFDTVDCGAGTDTAYGDAGDTLVGCELPAPPQVDPPPPVDPPVDPPADEPGNPPADDPGDPGSGTWVPADTTSPADDSLPVVPSGEPPVVTGRRLALGQRVLTVDARGFATLVLTCPTTETNGCRGRVLLDPASRRRRGKPRARAASSGRYGRAKFAAAAGQTVDVRIGLSPSARRALGMPRGRKARAARRGRVSAVVTVKQNGRRPVKTKVRLKR